jgi:hypothetical protein
MPNHFHLLLRTGDAPISTVMKRLLTGYAVRFNRRHRRSGHLFQNRYKSILCQEDVYLLELVRYIHLNPLRAKLVVSMGELDRFEFCGHGVILGKQQKDWQLEKRTRMRARGVDPQRAAARVEEIFGLSLAELSHGSRVRSVVRARSVLCYWAVTELGMSGAQAARWLGIGQPAVQRSVVRGERIARELNLVLSP